jgi:hypothetical protein
MPGQAQITSIESLETFRSDLVVFLSQMQPVMDEAGGEVTRMKYWLQNEQREFWENQARRRRRQLEEAQAELLNARLSRLQVSSSAQQLAVQRAKRAMQETEEKLALLKKWDRELENLTDPLLKPVGQLQGFLATDMNKAVAYLAQSIQALEAYTDVAAPNLPATPATSADETKASS